MRPKTWRRRGRRVARLAFLTVLTAGPVALVTVWFCLQHKPGWYRPAVLDDAGMQRARAGATGIVDSVSDRMVQGRPFDVVLLDRQVNEWLTALPHSWPEVQRSMPREITDPAVRFETGKVRVGAHCERGGWRAIISVGLSVRVSADGDSIETALTEAHGGSLPVPRWILDMLLDSLLQRGWEARDGAEDAPASILPGLDHVGSADDLFRGVKVSNRFIWQNGDRPFRIDAITIEDGTLRLSLEPL